MSINEIHLNKFLKLIYMSDRDLTRELRADIRSEIKKSSGQSSGGGGHFYMPFWSDVKRHVLGEVDLTDATQERIEANRQKRNLYPLLRDGFLELWRRGGNQRVKVIDKSPKGRYEASDQLTIKVENVMAISINENERLGYPYWFPEPSLSEEGARIGLWVMENALATQNNQNMRIFDIMRSEFYSLENSPLHGDEEKALLDHFDRILKLRQKLRSEDRYN